MVWNEYVHLTGIPVREYVRKLVLLLMETLSHKSGYWEYEEIPDLRRVSEISRTSLLLRSPYDVILIRICSYTKDDCSGLNLCALMM